MANLGHITPNKLLLKQQPPNAEETFHLLAKMFSVLMDKKYQSRNVSTFAAPGIKAGPLPV